MERMDNDWVCLVALLALLALGCGTADGADPDGGEECADPATETYTETVTAPDGTDADTETDTETATTEAPPPCWAAGTDGAGYWCAPSVAACDDAGGAVTAFSCGDVGMACCHLPHASTLDDPGQCNGYLAPSGLCWLYPQVPGPLAGGALPRIMAPDHEAWCADTGQLGHDDWREATLDELRPYLHGCPDVEVGGACVITEGMVWDWALVAPGGPCAGCQDAVEYVMDIETWRDVSGLPIRTATTIRYQNGVTGHVYVDPQLGRLGPLAGGSEEGAYVTPRCVRVPVSGEGT